MQSCGAARAEAAATVSDTDNNSGPEENEAPTGIEARILREWEALAQDDESGDGGTPPPVASQPSSPRLAPRRRYGAEAGPSRGESAAAHSPESEDAVAEQQPEEAAQPETDDSAGIAVPVPSADPEDSQAGKSGKRSRPKGKKRRGKTPAVETHDDAEDGGDAGLPHLEVPEKRQAKQAAREERSKRKTDKARQRLGKAEDRTAQKSNQVDKKQSRAEARTAKAQDRVSAAEQAALAARTVLYGPEGQQEDPLSDDEQSDLLVGMTRRSARLATKARKLGKRSTRIDVSSKSSRARKMQHKAHRIATRTEKKLAAVKEKAEKRAQNEAEKTKKVKKQAAAKMAGQGRSVRRQRKRANAAELKEQKKLEEARARETVRDERARKRLRRRQSRRLKAPKEAKEQDDGNQDKKTKKAEEGKPSKEDRKRTRKEEKAAARRKPPRGKATVLVVDGTHASLIVLRNGRAVGVSDEEYEDYELAIDASSKYRAQRLVWANQARARTLSRPADGESKQAAEVIEAQDLIDTFGSDSPLLTVLSGERYEDKSPIGVEIQKQWGDHRIFQRHQKRVVVSGQCHGSEPGYWLRIGHLRTELTYVAQGGIAVDWAGMPPLEMLPERVGEPPPNYGSGMDAFSKLVEAKSPEEAAPEFTEAVFGFADGRIQLWVTGGLGPLETLWVHGPGVNAHGLLEHFSDRFNIAVLRPAVDAAPSVTDHDQLATALNAWGRPVVSDPGKVISKAQRARLRKIIKKLLYGTAALSVLVGWSIWQGQQVHARIDTASERQDAANTRLEIARNNAPPDPRYQITGALNWIGCPQSATEAAAAAEADAAAGATEIAAAVRVPIGYDPARWPDGWDAVILSSVAVELSEELSQQVTIGHSALQSEVEEAQRIAAQFQSGEITDPDGDGISDDLDSEFSDVGLSPETWRLFAWAQTNYVGQQPYVPPISTRLCAAGGPDLLWKAQNEPLIPAMLARQIQGYPGWLASDPYGKDQLENTSIGIKQAHVSYSFEEVSVFVAWLLHERDVADVLRPLAFRLWGEDGVVQIPQSLARRCISGIHPATGEPLQTCGSGVSVLIGPRHLLTEQEWETQLRQPAADGGG